MTEERTKLLAKIHKLLELGDRNKNNSVHEAALAAAMAQELMFKHKIATAELEDCPDDDYIEADVLENERALTVVTWKRIVLATLANAHFCEAVYARNIADGKRTGRERLLVIGQKGDVDAVVYLYKYLCLEINRLAKAVMKTSFNRTTAVASARAFGNSFRLGAARMIGLRLLEQHEALVRGHPTSSALVKRANDGTTEFLRKKHGEAPARSADTRASPLNRMAYTLGCAAGSRVVLNAESGRLGTGIGRLDAATVK